MAETIIAGENLVNSANYGHFYGERHQTHILFARTKEKEGGVIYITSINNKTDILRRK